MEKTSPVNNESPNVGEGSDVRGSPEEEYILKWTDHKVNFFSLAAADLFNDEDLTDVTICCGEKLFDAHKLILSVCSPYFKSMLTHKKKLNVIITKIVKLKKSLSIQHLIPKTLRMTLL